VFYVFPAAFNADAKDWRMPGVNCTGDSFNSVINRKRNREAP
jgi:hypothetical protein